ncbi:Ras guanine nucleotide exchange factor bud5 [Marasmius tenuissimus]|uniref:Ras guanine nucleotide exchange factor bud5 n=1 Tax=Marasmius tenuissimus TaxID=585030 RepID=A0ABR3A794_9AGAR
MVASQDLRIDTTWASLPQPGPSVDHHPNGNETDSPPLPNPHVSLEYLNPRPRTISNSSATSVASSLNIISPASASTNASTVSLVIPGPGPSSASSSNRSASPNDLVSPLSASIEERDNYDSMVEREYVLAMHDYIPPEGSTCLSFRAGQVIHVLNRDPSGWWDGELEGKRGWFPSNFVHVEEEEDEVEHRDIVEEEDEAEETFNARMPLSMRRGNQIPTHVYTCSNESATGLNGSTPRRPTTASTIIHSNSPSIHTPPVPPIIVPLYRTVSLLSSAARENRSSHFSPSTATIITCVRTILTATDTLSKDAEVLRANPELAGERKSVLAALASLVAQTRRAAELAGSGEGEGEGRGDAGNLMDDGTLEIEVDSMLRMAQQLFALVRRFLAVAVQCGIELRPASSDGEREDLDVDVQENGYHDDYHQKGDETITQDDEDNFDRPVVVGIVDSGKTPTKSLTSLRRRPGTPGGRTKSMGDLRSRRRQQQQSKEQAPPLPSGTTRHKPEISISSTASSSSSSYGGPIVKPPKPLFPCGPCTVTQVMEALRYTHDHYLSTIAAFIGHAHTHSRASHASSTGHLYELVNEIVEMSCKLLAIVEAVLQHPDIPYPKLQPLRGAKETLYNVTSDLAESVRRLGTPLDDPLSDSGDGDMSSEEEEKQGLLRCATLALRSGADLAAAVKLCLTRTVSERRAIAGFDQVFVLNVPSLGQPGSPSNVEIRERYRAERDEGEEEDMTIQPQGIGTIPPGEAASSSSEAGSIASSGGFSKRSISLDTDDTSHEGPHNDRMRPRPLTFSTGPAREPPLASPTSFMRSDEDGATTWEGSTRSHPSHSPALEDKIFNGELPDPPSHEIIPDPDFLADPAGYMFRPDYAHDDIAYNTEGVLVGATLEVLVEKLTPHESIVDPAFSAVFFMTFRLFCSPVELVEALIARYNVKEPEGLPREHSLIWQQSKGVPVRLRVANFIKSWLEVYWRPETDYSALSPLCKFTQEYMAKLFPGPGERILGMIRMYAERGAERDTTLVSPKGDRTRDPGMSLNPPPSAVSMSLNMNGSMEVPRPTMTKPLLALLRAKNFEAIAITDFDALELARQLTIMECRLYCAITPEEVMESGQEGARTPVNVRAVSSLSTTITGWAAESILNEKDMKKRTGLVKFFVKVADKCTTLHNFSTSRSILAALDSSTIARLHQTWNGLPQKSKVQLEVMRRLADHSRNYREYRARLRNTAPPAVPFLGLYLTDITFCREGNPSHRASPYNQDKKLLNFNKYHKLARIVQDMQRFQVPYNLKVIDEVQEYLQFVFKESKKKGDLQDLYRRSLMVEPKQPADAPPPSQLFAWTRSQSSSSLAPPSSAS